MSIEDIENAMVPNKAEAAAQRYSERTWFRALVVALPNVGGSLDILITQEYQKFRERRLKVVLSAMGREIQRLGEEKLDRGFLKSEEWFDLLTSSLEKAIKVREERRLKAIGKVLALSAVRSETLVIDPVDLVSILAELSEPEAAVLGIVDSVYKDRVDLLTGSQNGLFTIEAINVVVPQALQPSLKLLCDRLVGKGLLDSIFEQYALSEAGKKVTALYINV